MKTNKTERGIIDVLIAVLIFFIFLYGTMILATKFVDFMAWVFEV